jgi:hypothetical protein
MAAEITIKVSNDEQKLTQKFLEYETISLTKDDPKLQQMVESTIKNFKGIVEDVVVKVKMVW